MSSQQMTKQDYDEEIFKKVKEMYPISSEYELLRARQMAKVLTFQRDELGIAILSDGPNISATLAKQHNQELRMEVNKKFWQAVKNMLNYENLQQEIQLRLTDLLMTRNRRNCHCSAHTATTRHTRMLFARQCLS